MIKNWMSFAKADIKWLELAREQESDQRMFPMWIMGCYKKLLGTSHLKLEYVDGHVSACIVQGNFFKDVRPRLTSIKTIDNGFVQVFLQIIDPRKE